MIYSIDIETENEGIDVLNGVRRVISAQIGDDERQVLHYVDSRDSHLSLEGFSHGIFKLIDEGHSFAGYNIKGFDLPILKKFLGVDIPASRTIDIMEHREIEQLRQKIGWKRLPLEKVCEAYHIDAGHKHTMQKASEKYATNDLLIEAEHHAQNIVREKGWSKAFALDYAVKSLSMKQAIVDSYREFVSHDGDHNSLFYRYAVGDIICEHKLLKLITGMGDAAL